MKKFILIVAAIAITILPLTLYGCNNEVLSDIPDNVSYVEAEVYWGQSDSFFIEVTRGKREVPLNANGKSQNVAQFFEVQITPSKAMDIELCHIAVSGDKGQIEGDAEISLTDNEFVFTTQENVEIGSAVSIIVTFGDKQETAELVDMLLGNLDWKAVLEIAKTEFNERLEADTTNSSREIFVKLARDRRALGGDCFWYVCYIGEKSDFWSLLIDVKDGTIIARK